MALRFVAPDLLTLVGAGFDQDPYAVDGWHFRWFVSPDLGLPREPFRLYARSTGTPDTWAAYFTSPLNQSLYQSFARSIGYGQRDVFYDLCRVFYASDRPVNFAGGPQLSSEPLVIDLRQRYAQSPQVTPSAARVLLEVTLEPGEDVYAAAETYTSDGYQLVDEAQGIYLIQMPRLPMLPPPGPETFRLVLSGEHIHRLQVRGAGIVEGCYWLETWDYVTNGNWDIIETIPLPVQDPAQRWYRDPAWDMALERAYERLMRGRSRAFPPWNQRDIPPPAGAPAPEPWEYEERYMPALDEQIRPRLESLLMESYEASIPQKHLRQSVGLAEPTGSQGGRLTAGSTEAEIPLLASLFFESMDYHMARLLGLGVVTQVGAGEWDFKLEATYTVADLERNEELWELLDLLNQSGETELLVGSFVPGLRRQRHDLPARPEDFHAALEGRATADGVAAHVRLGWESRRPDTPGAQAEVPLVYALAREGPDGIVDLNPYDDVRDTYLPLLPARDKDGRALFHDLKLPQEGDYVYHLSASDMWDRWSPWADTTFTYEDDQLPLPPGNVRVAFIVSGDKDFLRLLEEDHKDEGAVKQAMEDAITWAADKGQALRISFEWTEDHTRQSPPVQAFSVRVRKGSIDLDAQGTWRELGQWPGIEAQEPPTTRDPLFVERPGQAPPTLTTGDLTAGNAKLVSAKPFQRKMPDGSDLRGTRYLLDLAGFDLPAPSVDRQRQYLSVGVAAHSRRSGKDFASPVSQPGVALLLYQDRPKPVTLPGLEWSSYPDATGRSQYELSWTRESGMSYAVYRTDDNALLAAAEEQTDQETKALIATFEGASDNLKLQAETLRKLAARPGTRRAFERLNDVPVPESKSKASNVTYGDALPGYARVRFIYCLLGLSPTGVEAEWPSKADAFVVVHVPSYVVPGIPRWERIEQGDDGVKLAFNIEGGRYDEHGALPQDMPDAIEIYR
ncbi:MAG: hypothetical protein PVI07_04110, partial [Anaerolineae bacterium]